MAEQLEYTIKGKKKRKKKLKIGVLCLDSLEEELEDTFYLSVRVAIENKIEREGFKKYQIRNTDQAEAVAALDGLICLGTSSKSMVDHIASFGKPVVGGCRSKERNLGFDCHRYKKGLSIRYSIAF